MGGKQSHQFWTGFSDDWLLGVPRWIRGLDGHDSTADPCSGWYKGGGYTSLAAGLGTGVRGWAQLGARVQALRGGTGTLGLGVRRLFLDNTRSYGAISSQIRDGLGMRNTPQGAIRELSHMFFRANGNRGPSWRHSSFNLALGSRSWNQWFNHAGKAGEVLERVSGVAYGIGGVSALSSPLRIPFHVSDGCPLKPRCCSDCLLAYCCRDRRICRGLLVFCVSYTRIEQAIQDNGPSATNISEHNR